MAEPGEAVILEGTTTATIGVRIIAMSGVYPSFNELQGFQVRGFSLDCVSYDGVPDIRLIGFDVSQCGRQSMALHRAQRVTLRASSIHDSNTNGWTSAIDLYFCSDGNVISGNRIWNNSDSSPGQPDSLKKLARIAGCFWRRCSHLRVAASASSSLDFRHCARFRSTELQYPLRFSCA